MKKNIAILISGRGSNMEALIRAVQQDINFPAQIMCVISDNKNAQGLSIASSLGIHTFVIEAMTYKNKQTYEEALNNKLLEYNIDLICLAGFMRLISSYLCQLWRDKMVNIHPSLLPSFKGLNTHERALKAGVKFTGCSIHWVTPEMDSGQIIAQAVVPVLTNDTIDTLSKRVLKAEHKLYPLALKSICNQSWHNDRISFFDDASVEKNI